MEPKGSNLFIGDRSFAQSWTLRFIESSTEKKYQVESIRFRWESMKIVFSLFCGIFPCLFFTGSLDFQSLLIAALCSAASMQVSNFLLKRALLQILSMTWQLTFFRKGSVSECIGALLPSLLMNLFLLNSWSKSFFFFITDSFFLNYLVKDCKINIGVSVISLTVFASVLEKDFRDLWYLYSSFKKSNSLNQALWDNFPGAELLVSKEGKIIYYNQCTLNLLKKLNRPLEVLKKGQFHELFRDFREQGKSLIQRSIKGEMNEEVYITKYKDDQERPKEASFIITADLFSWVSGNCSRVSCIDVTTHITRKCLILECFREISEHLKSLTSLLFQLYSESKPANQEFMTTFYKMMCHFKGMEAIQSHFSGEICLKLNHFNLNSEIFNTIEVLYLKSCNHNVSVTYTREQAIPLTLIGDKDLHNVAIYALLDYVILNALEGSEIFVLVQVASAGPEEITISYKFTFKSDKVTNLDIENFFSARKNLNNVKEISEIQNIFRLFGAPLASVDSILLALKGYLVPASSEVDPKKVIINICIPFKTGSADVKSSLIKISQNFVQETPLTSKWKPDLAVFQKFYGQNQVSEKDQFSIVTSKNHSKNCVVQVCEKLEINPLKKDSPFENSISDLDLGEESDICLKMNNYSFLPHSFKAVIQPVLLKTVSGILKTEDFSASNLILVDEKGENIKSLGNPESIKENIYLASDREKGIEICNGLLNKGKKITSFLFTVEKGKDTDFVKQLRDVEKSFGVVLNLCGLSLVPADLNYCKNLGISNFSKVYLVVKPISYSQVAALVKKIELL